MMHLTFSHYLKLRYKIAQLEEDTSYLNTYYKTRHTKLWKHNSKPVVTNSDVMSSERSFSFQVVQNQMFWKNSFFHFNLDIN